MLCRTTRVSPLLLAALVVSCSSTTGPPPTGDGLAALADGAISEGHAEAAAADLAGGADGAGTDSAIPWPDTGGLARCSFTTPTDGAEIADSQTYVELATDSVADGSVAAMLVNFVPKASAQVIGGKAEFPSVELPPPSDKPVELRAEVKLNYAQKINCRIAVKVVAP